jgi:hypothetical protein
LSDTVPAVTSPAVKLTDFHRSWSAPVRLLPRDERFFDLFSKVAELNLEAAHLLQEILKTDNERRLPLVER